MNFTIYLAEKGKSFALQVSCTKQTDYVEEYTVVAGAKQLLFRCNRPELRNFKKRGSIKWQLVSKSFDIAEKDFQKAAMYLLEIQDKIEMHIEPLPTFQQIRNKI